MLKRHVDAVQAKIDVEATRYRDRRSVIVEAQRADRAELAKVQQARWDNEARDRAQRLRRGFRGIWDRLTGRHREVTRQNEREAQRAQERDPKEKDDLIQRQLAARRALHHDIRQSRRIQTDQLAALYRDLAEFMRRIEKSPAASP